MVTNYPQRLTATTTGIDEAQTAGSVMNRAIARVRAVALRVART